MERGLIVGAQSVRGDGRRETGPVTVSLPPPACHPVPPLRRCLERRRVTTSFPCCCHAPVGSPVFPPRPLFAQSKIFVRNFALLRDELRPSLTGFVSVFWEFFQNFRQKSRKKKKKAEFGTFRLFGPTKSFLKVAKKFKNCSFLISIVLT